MLEKGYSQVGLSFPVFLHPDTREEYALARTEKKSGVGHGGFTCDASSSVTLKQDLSRRDLTINAIAMDDDNCIIDPFRGVDDIHGRILRHVSPAFAEDPLRVLRVARLAAQLPEFSIHPETSELMKKVFTRGELQHLEPDRVRRELYKALKSHHSWKFFQVLHDHYADQHVFPEFYRLWDVPQPPEHHPEGTVDRHMDLVMAEVSALSDDTGVRFAALCHDLGKGVTPKPSWPQHIDHEKNGVSVIETMCDRLQTIPKHHIKLAKICAEFHLKYHKLFEMRAGKIVKLLDVLEVKHGLDLLSNFAAVCIADETGRGNSKCNRIMCLRRYTFLAECAEAYNDVCARLADRDGNKHDGKKIGELLHQDRCEAVQQVIKDWKKKLAG